MSEVFYDVATGKYREVDNAANPLPVKAVDSTGNIPDLITILGEMNENLKAIRLLLDDVEA